MLKVLSGSASYCRNTLHWNSKVFLLEMLVAHDRILIRFPEGFSLAADSTSYSDAPLGVEVLVRGELEAPSFLAVGYGTADRCHHDFRFGNLILKCAPGSCQDQASLVYVIGRSSIVVRETINNSELGFWRQIFFGICLQIKA